MPCRVDDGVVTVVGLGAWCDFVTEDAYRHRLVGVSFVVHEFADLADGRRLTLHEERGFSGVTMSTEGTAPSDQWRHLTLENLERDVRTTVLPDDDDTLDEHPWEWLAELLRLHGVEATAEELRFLPYYVEFSERLRARVVANT
jgi:hypothetical protein